MHGRDEDNKNALRDMLTGWGFEPIILAEQPNRGRSLLEKLLVHTSVSSVGYVFVLMTPDDVGATRDKTEDFVTMLFNLSLANATHATGAELLREYLDTFKPRVRQNVMFEYGLCVGSLGRERVCLLVGGGEPEIPSDVLGFGYISFDKKLSECQEKIKGELGAAYGEKMGRTN